MIRFTKKNIIISSVIFSLIILLSITLYMTMISPKKEEIKTVMQEVDNEETQIALIEEKIKKIEEKVQSSNTFLYQRQLPVSPLADQFILMLEKAEVLSNTVILDMQLSNSEASLTADNEENQEEQNKRGNVKALEATLKISADDYYEIETFMDTIQQLERVTFVDQVKFKGKEEVIEMQEDDDDVEKIQAELVVTTYYAPDFKNVKQNGPSIEFPQPSEKTTPLYEEEQKKNNEEK